VHVRVDESRHHAGSAEIVLAAGRVPAEPHDHAASDRERRWFEGAGERIEENQIGEKIIGDLPAERCRDQTPPFLTR
jgi:hypothetical protein